MMTPKILRALGHWVTDRIWRLGFAARFLLMTLVYSGTALRRLQLTIRETYFTGVLSLVIILVSGLFVGMVLGLQGYETLQRYGSSEALGVLVALSLVRELGPVVAALLFASRAGSAITAEIGLTRAPEGLYAEWIACANRLAERDACPVLALDCPSGLNAETGVALSSAIRASHTLSFISAKPGLYTADGPDHCGDVRIADLGLDSVAERAPDGWLLSRDDFAERLKPRRLNTHKGSFGNAGVLGGAKSMVGAAFLAGRAALKLGAGRVYVGLLDGEAPAVDLQQPELMLRRADVLLQTDLQALACGPGLGRSSEALRLLEQSLKAPVQLVLDADALNLLADDGRLEGNLYNRVGPAILTPHPAEAARLLGCSVRDIQNDRVRAAVELADRYRSHIALKGCGTVIALTDGRWWINSTGNPGMATAGMGDVLCGLIIALLAQNWPPEMALLAAVHLHGAAADRLVARGDGPVGLTAGEVIDPARALFNSWVSGKVAL